MSGRLRAKLTVGNYLVFYAAMGDAVEVRRFSYGVHYLTKVLL